MFKLVVLVTALVCFIPLSSTSSSLENDSVIDSTLDGSYFSVLDYSIFIAMVALSALIGIYYGFISKQKQDTTAEYLMGGKKMNYLPVAASLISSNISGVTILGLPTDVYANGSQYWMCLIPIVVISLALTYVYLPIFHELQMNSCFAYLERRFDYRVRVTASLVYALANLLFLPIVIYVPAMALSQVTSINVHILTPIICVICIFYTSVGGLKAVVWTDFIQFISILAGIVTVVFVGTSYFGGFRNVFNIADEGGRFILFNMDPNPLIKYSFWTISLGMTASWMCTMGVSQGSIQKFLAVPSLSKATKVVWLNALGMFFIKSCGCYIGFLLFSEYKDCDPVASGMVKKLDKMMPYYVMNISKNIPGLPGLFISGIMAAGLSTMSAMLNTLSGTIYEDFIKHRIKNVTEKTSSNIMKCIVVIVGIIVVLSVFWVEKMGAILHFSYSIHGLTSGTLLGIYTIGMISRRVNTKGVIIGSIVSLSTVGFILIGAQLNVSPPLLSVNVDGCTNLDTEFYSNYTKQLQHNEELYKEVPWVFRISFLYYALIGVTTLIVVAYPISILTGGCEITDERLLATFCRSKEYKNRTTENTIHHVDYIEVKELPLSEVNDIDKSAINSPP